MDKSNRLGLKIPGLQTLLGHGNSPGDEVAPIKPPLKHFTALERPLRLAIIQMRFSST